MPKKILLLGHNGYLGSNIYKSLIHENHVYVLSKEEILEFNKSGFLKYDFEFDVFINCIVVYSNDSLSKVIEGNIYSPLKICEHILKSKHFTAIYFDSFYSKFFSNSYDSMYLLSKSNLFHWVKTLHNYNSNITSYFLRLEHVVGKNESKKKFNGWLIENLKKDKNIELSQCNHKLDFIYIYDIVKAVIILINQNPFKGEFKMLELGSGFNYKLKDFVLKLKNKLNSNSKITFKKEVDKHKTQNSISNNKNLIDLGWRPITDLDKIVDLII